MTSQVDHVPCGILNFDDAGIILSSNRTLEVWLGYNANELISKNITHILTVAGRIFYNTHLFPMVRLHMKAEEIFLNLLCKHGEELPVISNTARHESEGKVVNCSVFIPVRQRRRYEDEIILRKRIAEEALRENKALIAVTKELEQRTTDLDQQYRKLVEMNQDLRQFSKIVSHDLREPQRKIELYANLLSEDVSSLPDKSRNYVTKILSAAERLSLLTQSLHQYLVADSGSLLTEVDLNLSLEVALDRAKRERGAAFLVFDSDKLPNIEGYNAQLELMFYHLIDNAIKFRKSGEKAYVKIRATIVEENMYQATADKYRYVEQVRIVLSDEGIGFSDEYQTHVLELLKKLDPASPGLGIGLALVKKVVKNHNGSLELQSAPDAGTRVTITLPLRQNYSQ